MKAVASILALVASAQAGQYMINQLGGQCVNVGASRCSAVPCQSASADQFQVQEQQIVVYGQENTCLVARNAGSKYVVPAPCDSPAAASCSWSWQGQQLVNSYEKCLTMKCVRKGYQSQKCWLVQTECAPVPAPAAPQPIVYQYQSQCWDMNSQYQSSDYYSPKPVYPVYQPQPQPQYPVQKPVYGGNYQKPVYGGKPQKPVYDTTYEQENRGYQSAPIVGGYY